MSAPRTRTALATSLALAGTVAELALLAVLVIGAPVTPAGTLAWLGAHALAGLGAGTGLALVGAARTRTAPGPWLPPCTALALAMPFVGAFGLGAALLAGTGATGAARARAPHWDTIEPVALPFTPPAARAATRPDTRGLGERLRHSSDLDALYRGVLAAASMPDALSVDALRTAVAHGDDRIRLTAYQTLDAKATRLNREIQRLEAGLERLEGDLDPGQERAAAARERSEAWLQVAANYRELLTLEETEPVARRQLLERACRAAARAVAAAPTSRSARFALGRLALLRGDLAAADLMLARAVELGMSPDTVAPWLAESAFAARDFPRVRRLLAAVSPARRAYPPLAQVAEHWT